MRMTDGSPKRTMRKARNRKIRKTPPGEAGRAGKLFKYLAWITLGLAALGILLAGLGAGGAYYAYRHFSRDLPRINTLQDYRPPVVTTVYADDGRKIAEFFKERRIVIPLSEMPDRLTRAFIAAEDSRFYSHKGVDIRSIIRAFIKNLEAGTVVQGGSTITQQVTKSFFLSPERSYRRKIREAILAYRIDQAFTKDDILYLYLNQIYLGHGAYGVQAAAQNYFGKDVADLTLAECATLAGLPQAPSEYSPFRHPEKARARRKYVLDRMVEEAYITRRQAEKAVREKLAIHSRRNLYLEQVPFYTEYVRQYVMEKYGEDALYKGGLGIHTAVDIDMQRIARQEVMEGLRELDRRHYGYRGPEKHLEPEEVEGFLASLAEERAEAPLEEGRIVRGVVTEIDEREGTAAVHLGTGAGILKLSSVRWHKKPGRIRAGDVLLVKLKSPPAETAREEGAESPKPGPFRLTIEQTPGAESALICLEAGTGRVKAMVGGKDFRKSQFNRAVQSRRQPGSAFKPIIYAAALDKGFTPATEIIDNAVVYEGRGREGKVWKPKNYDRKFHGPILLRKALAKSRNLSTIKILNEIGVDYAVDYARKLGIASDLYPDLSLALGASAVTPLELVQAYAVFANLGEYVEPVFVTRIEDRFGKVLEEADIRSRPAIEKSTAYIMTSLLESVVQEGTGRRVRALGRPTAGKTGTTNDLFDAWFVGYTPDYITGVWVGHDHLEPLGKGETGSRAASPIWLGFMERVLEGKPVKSFQVPKGVVFTRIDAETGLLPISETSRTIYECFKEGTVPEKHSESAQAISGAADFFKSDI